MCEYVRNMKRSLLLLIAVLGAVAACSTETSDDGDSSEDAFTEGTSIKIASFNAGLVRGGVALVDERVPLIAPAIEKTGADVICLQEVWGDEDYEKIRASLADKYPHAFRQKTEEHGRRWFSCNPFKLNTLKGCVDSKCTPTGVSAEECVQNACKDEYSALSDRCMTCLAANTDSPTSCIFVADEFVQGGRNGVALFSKYPITDARFIDFGSAMVHRGAIRATIEGKAIACTHLSSDLTTVPYPTGHYWHSWAEEQQSEIATVVNALPSDGCRIAVGDMNSSPDNGGIRPEVPETLAGFTAKGFKDWSSQICTWCPPPANPLASGRETKVYDHVLLNGCGARAKYSRIMDQPVEVVHDGQTLETRLSDHFGVMVEIAR